MQTEAYWLWLTQLNLSPKARYTVIRNFGDAESAFRSPADSFRNCRGISPREAELLEQRDLSAAKAALIDCEEQELRILPITDPDYPERLRQIFCPPAVLFIQGTLPEIDGAPVLAVIGTRKASPYGIRMGQELARQIADCGGTVLSLLTPGVDEAAARGALLSGKPCLGVLGTPHAQYGGKLGKDILKQGALISEYPPGRETAKHFFRERNRIAAGLSVGVVVVEAPEKSGTALFVTDAVEQGKDIFAVPGNADAVNSAGTLSMLKEGAKLVTCGEEVMEEYETRFPAAVGRAQTSEPPKTPEHPSEKAEDEAASAEKTDSGLRELLSGLTEEQLRILSAIEPGASHIDELAENTGFSTARILAQLTVLEIKGFVRREPGRRFSLNIRKEK